MELSRLGWMALAASLATIITPLALASPTNTFTTGGYYSGYDNNNTSGKMNVTYGGKYETVSAGNFAGSTAVINGASVAFSSVYCVDLNDYINLNTTYTASFTTTGVVNGATVSDDGAIAWLLINESPLTTTADQDEGLQAAIWKEEYGSNFSLSSNNDAALIAAYNADLAAVGSISQSVLTADIGKVEWITPTTNGWNDQDQVGLVKIAPTPEPGSLVLLGTGMLGVAGAARRRFKKVQ